MLNRMVPVAVVLAAILLTIVDAQSQETANGTSSAVQVDLQTQLEKGLRARRPEEFAYLKRVVIMVDEGDLPEVLVRTTYGYAVKKSRVRRSYPFQYFQWALKFRAAQLGIDVPTI